MFKYILGVMIFTLSGFVSAEMHKGMFAYNYSTIGADISANGLTVDGDITQNSMIFGYFVNDNIELIGSKSTGKYELIGEEIDMDSSVFGFRYHISRVDMQEGTGSGFSFGVSSNETKMNYAGISADGSETFLSVGYSTGLGNGLSLNFSSIAQADEIGDNNGIAVSLAKCTLESICFQGGYQYSAADSEGISIDGSGFSLGLGVLF
ncbi:MAG: hypothetical protein HN886_00090 [Woeseiaceae bacterium]|jgi:hypothetical protein|nr:hypothetical protein [Woeseiaceae bacterium]